MYISLSITIPRVQHVCIYIYMHIRLYDTIRISLYMFVSFLRAIGTSMVCEN